MEEKGRLLAIDYGLGKVGLAIADIELQIINELPPLSIQQGIIPLIELQKIIEQHDITILVWGLCCEEQHINWLTPLVLAHAAYLRLSNFKIKSYYVNEYLTTQIYKTDSAAAANFALMFLQKEAFSKSSSPVVL